MTDDPASDPLDRAWRWYVATREVSRSMARLGERYWPFLPWDGRMGEDPQFKDLEASQVEAMARDVLASLDDLGVLLLFSAFEAMVRERITTEVAEDASAVSHPASLSAMKRMNKEIDTGNFENVLNFCSGPETDLLSEVKRVRDYRNWVAHGRRRGQPPRVAPEDAHQLLRGFLDGLAGFW